MPIDQAHAQEFMAHYNAGDQDWLTAFYSGQTGRSVDFAAIRSAAYPGQYNQGDLYSRPQPGSQAGQQVYIQPAHPLQSGELAQEAAANRRITYGDLGAIGYTEQQSYLQAEQKAANAPGVLGGYSTPQGSVQFLQIYSPDPEAGLKREISFASQPGVIGGVSLMSGESINFVRQPVQTTGTLTFAPTTKEQGQDVLAQGYRIVSPSQNEQVNNPSQSFENIFKQRASSITNIAMSLPFAKEAKGGLDYLTGQIQGGKADVILPQNLLGNPITSKLSSMTVSSLDYATGGNILPIERGIAAGVFEFPISAAKTATSFTAFTTNVLHPGSISYAIKQQSNPDVLAAEVVIGGSLIMPGLKGLMPEARAAAPEVAGVIGAGLKLSEASYNVLGASYILQNPKENTGNLLAFMAFGGLGEQAPRTAKATAQRILPTDVYVEHGGAVVNVGETKAVSGSKSNEIIPYKEGEYKFVSREQQEGTMMTGGKMVQGAQLTIQRPFEAPEKVFVQGKGDINAFVGKNGVVSVSGIESLGIGGTEKMVAQGNFEVSGTYHISPYDFEIVNQPSGKIEGFLKDNSLVKPYKGEAQFSSPLTRDITYDTTVSNLPNLEDFSIGKQNNYEQGSIVSESFMQKEPPSKSPSFEAPRDNIKQTFNNFELIPSKDTADITGNVKGATGFEPNTFGADIEQISFAQTYKAGSLAKGTTGFNPSEFGKGVSGELSRADKLLLGSSSTNEQGFTNQVRVKSLTATEGGQVSESEVRMTDLFKVQQEKGGAFSYRAEPQTYKTGQKTLDILGRKIQYGGLKVKIGEDVGGFILSKNIGGEAGKSLSGIEGTYPKEETGFGVPVGGQARRAEIGMGKNVFSDFTRSKMKFAELSGGGQQAVGGEMSSSYKELSKGEARQIAGAALSNQLSNAEQIAASHLSDMKTGANLFETTTPRMIGLVSPSQKTFGGIQGGTLKPGMESGKFKGFSFENLRINTNLDVGQGQNNNVANLLGSLTSQQPRTNQENLPIQKQVPGEITNEKLRPLEIQRQEFYNPQPPKNPPFKPWEPGGGGYTPYNPGGGGFIPSFELNLGSITGYSAKTKRPKGQYEPSLTAATFGIKGPKGKSELSGFGLRPIPTEKKQKKQKYELSRKDMKIYGVD